MAIEIKGYIVSDDDKPIYDFFGISTTAPQDVRNAIAEAKGALLDVEISTCYGGDVFAGSTIYSALRSYKGGVHIHITGLAASAASVIAMAGRSDMSPTAQLMVHCVSTVAQGNYHAMDSSSAALQEADKAIAAAYAEKSGMSEDDALKLMENETWINAAHAVELGLVDKISDAAPQLVNAAYGLPLSRTVIEKTRALLAEKKANVGEKPESNKASANEESKPQPAPSTEADEKVVALARAKLNLIEKSNF